MDGLQSIRGGTQLEDSDQVERPHHQYAVLSHVNRAIVRARSRDELFQSVCHVAVKYGHFRLAWIGTRDTETDAVTLRARDCDEQGFPLAVPASECGVVRSAMRDGRPCVSDMTTGRTAPGCQVQAMRADIGSCAAFPIFSQGTVCGGLPSIWDQRVIVGHPLQPLALPRS